MTIFGRHKSSKIPIFELLSTYKSKNRHFFDPIKKGQIWSFFGPVKKSPNLGSQNLYLLTREEVGQKSARKFDVVKTRVRKKNGDFLTFVLGPFQKRVKNRSIF
jgi:hypothetical protein